MGCLSSHGKGRVVDQSPTYLVWVKQCHKPPIRECLIQPIKMVMWGIVFILFYPHYMRFVRVVVDILKNQASNCSIYWIHKLMACSFSMAEDSTLILLHYVTLCKFKCHAKQVILWFLVSRAWPVFHVHSKHISKILIFTRVYHGLPTQVHPRSIKFPYGTQKIHTGWWCNNHLEKYESQWEGWHPI